MVKDLQGRLISIQSTQFHNSNKSLQMIVDFALITSVKLLNAHPSRHERDTPQRNIVATATNIIASNILKVHQQQKLTKLNFQLNFSY